MRNIKLLISFDGTSYSGWQRQKGPATIQGVIEEKISIMTGEIITLHGAGRTDAGVHALGMTANFHTEANIPVSGFQRGLNSLLPHDIRIVSLEEVDDNFHARFSAKGKTYIYRVCCASVLPPHLRLYYAHLPYVLNFVAIKDCLKIIEGEHDFSSFETPGSRIICKTGCSGRGAVREIYSAILKNEPDGDYKCFNIEITGNGFLRYMVRNILGTVFQVGRGLKNVSDFKQILESRNRSLAGACAPARGLFLKEVFY